MELLLIIKIIQIVLISNEKIKIWMQDMANSTEREGVHYCGMIAEQNNWLFREQPIDDVGIDAHIEFIDESGKTRQLIHKGNQIF